MDAQSEAIYEFEDRFPWTNQNSMTLAQCRTLVASACRAYGVPPPTVVQHHKRSMSWCIPMRRKISIQAAGPNNRGGKNVATVLHEAAHQIAYDLCGNRVDDHGPTFCGIYFHLLTVAGWPASAIRAVAREHKVKWVERPPKWFKESRVGRTRLSQLRDAARGQRKLPRRRGPIS